jgi:hypothetical protein
MRIYGPERQKVKEDWRRLHNEELCRIYALPNNIKVI